MHDSQSFPPPRPISTVLRDFVTQSTPQHSGHNLVDYADEFSRTRYVATRLLRIGPNCVAIELADGSVLNMTKTRKLAPDMGTRPFDLPIVQKRCWERPYGRDLIYFIQPPADVPVTDDQQAQFSARLQALGYRFADPEIDNRFNLGIYQGRVALLDPWAVCCPRPISELLWETHDEPEGPLIDYTGEVFDGSPLCAWCVMWVGSDCVVLEQTDGNVLKLTMRCLPDDLGKRPFDAPILDHGRIPLPPQRRETRKRPSRKRHRMPPTKDSAFSNVSFFVQPRVETPVTQERLNEFFNIVRSHGYALTDPSVHNLGIYAGKLVLIDPFAVKRQYPSQSLKPS